MRDDSSNYVRRDWTCYDRCKEDPDANRAKKRGSVRRQSEKRATSTENKKERPLKSMLKKPRNLQPPSKRFMEAPERSISLNRYNRYFNDPTFDPTARFKRAQERVDKLQKQVSSFEKNENLGSLKTSECKNSQKDAKKSSKASVSKASSSGDLKQPNQKQSSSDHSKDDKADADDTPPSEGNESSRSVPRSVFQYLYDTDGRPLNQEAKRVQRELEEDYEESKRNNLMPRKKV